MKIHMYFILCLATLGIIFNSCSGPLNEAGTDLEKGFIRAEVIAFDDFVAARGEAGAKEKGLLRLEGKDYVVRDGDAMHFRFNV